MYRLFFKYLGKFFKIALSHYHQSTYSLRGSAVSPNPLRGKDLRLQQHAFMLYRADWPDVLTYTVPRRKVHNPIDYRLSLCASLAANNVGGYWRIVHQFAVVHYGYLIIVVRESHHACGVSV